MKKEQRVVYIELAKEIDGSLCTFCKYGEWQREGCCEGYSECRHPIENLSYQSRCEDDLEPGGDCYGFKPLLSVTLVADIVGAALSQGYDEWYYRRFSPSSVTVYGRSFHGGVETSGKVRIG